MIGYIIAAFSILSLILGGTTFYYKDRYDDAVQFQITAKAQAKQQEEYVKLLKHQATRQTEIINEQYQLEINRLTANIDSLRKQTNRSSLSSIPRSTKTPNEITFDREKLDQAIQGYRLEVSKLIGEVSDCQVELSVLNEWIEKQRNILGTE